MTTVCCLSDLHGHLPEVPPCDLLLLAGDYCRNHRDRSWYDRTFRWWLTELRDRGTPVVGVAGNHDFLFEQEPAFAHSLPWTYLCDSGCTAAGLSIWGSPWQPRFYDWAFNLDEPELVEKWALIPDGIDVLLLHGPPHGYGDFSPMGRVHTGSPGLAARIEQLKPRLVVNGHIHSGYGVYTLGETTVVNAAHVDESYHPANPPVLQAI
jgi:predicted phosphodiesterase